MFKVGSPYEINGRTYDIKSVLGKGGLSTVFLAIEHETNIKVAIKKFFYEKFTDPITKENDCVVFWKNEVLNTQAQAKSGMHCVEVIDYAEIELSQETEYYIILSFVEGKTFKSWYREFINKSHGLENLDLASVVRNIFIPMAKLLNFCHNEEGIIHRDIAVENIIIQEDEDDEMNFWPVLIDWGISKFVGQEWVDDAPKPYMTGDMDKDIPIKQKGAPPEIRNGYEPCAASDIYYLGHLMYFVFTGGLLREDSELTSHKAYVMHARQFNWFLPERYDEDIQKFTQYEPADRPKNMDVVIKMLTALIKINQIHFDFDFFFSNTGDTDDTTGLAREGNDSVCGKVPPKNDLLKEQDKPVKEDKSVTQPSTKPERTIPCLHCNRKFGTEKAMVQHMNVKHADKI